jgi:hypothetical protein
MTKYGQGNPPNKSYGDEINHALHRTQNGCAHTIVRKTDFVPPITNAIMTRRVKYQNKL